MSALASSTAAPYLHQAMVRVRHHIKKHSLRLLLLLALLLAGPMSMLAMGQSAGADWRTASRDPVGIAPDPAVHPQPIVQVYAARAYGWRGAFGVHSWISLKEESAASYENWHVLRWRARYGGAAVSRRTGPPDRRWFGSAPQLVAHLEGNAAAAAIPKIRAAIEAYPYTRDYTLWPGPNSNTFTAWVGRAVPALELDLPPTAIGKDYRGAEVLGAATSGTGVQFSLFGLLGVTAALREGVEVNVAGLTVGLDFDDLNLKLPGVGRVGPAPNRRAEQAGD
ncbi:MAG: DUF3750 domain-containing protein [Marivibrio sp.]|uniref:DUF3750 domain-containing protein n=1 Tax=Marivibrio sp. TaxID=2039719 RepID=UPI0032ECDC31